MSRLETLLIRCVTLDFRAVNLARKVLKYTRETMGWVRNLGKFYHDFHHFPSEMCRQAGFNDGGETALRPVNICKARPCSHLRTMLATTSSPCRTNVSLLLKHVFVSNGIQGYCFDTMSLLRLTLLRLGNVAPISVCLHARPKMAPGWPLYSLCMCLLWLDICCC